MAREFEATFLSMIIKQMRETLDQDGGGLFPGDSGDVQGGLFDMFLGRHLADSGGVGLAAVIERNVRPTTPPGPGMRTDELHQPLPPRGHLA
jgi:flagellar protein FlgJ